MKKPNELKVILLDELQGKNIYITPKSRVTDELCSLVVEHVIFLGFIDSSPKKNNSILPEKISSYDYIIVHHPSYWKEISQYFDKNKVLIKADFCDGFIPYFEYIKYMKRKVNCIEHDVLLVPFNKSNVMDLSIVSRFLKKYNLKPALVYVGEAGEKNIIDGFKDNKDIDVVYRDSFSYIDNKILVVSIDWVPQAQVMISNSKKRGIIIVGIVDGIEDFDDEDYDYKRKPYKSVDYVLLMGKDDRSGLTSNRRKSTVVGLPKLAGMYKEQVFFPKQDKVLINVNFTYGTHEEERESWLKSIIDICDDLNLKYIISQHHADNGILNDEIVSDIEVYNEIRQCSLVISRFSTIIIESLVLGKPVIYFNPHNESVSIYKKPLGAYAVANNETELKIEIRQQLKEKHNVRMNANEFLINKCNIDSAVSSGNLAAYRIKNIIDEADNIQFNNDNNFCIRDEYVSRTKYHHYDDMNCEDEWQLEVYLHVLGVMIKNSLSVVIDFGCGSGFKLITYLGCYNTIGYEVESNILSLNNKYPSRNWKKSDFSECLVQSDVIICSDVIEHMINPDDLMNYFCKQKFEYLILSTPERDLVYAKTDPENYGPPRNKAHQREWNKQEFYRYVSKYFNIVEHKITNIEQSTQMVVCKKISKRII